MDNWTREGYEFARKNVAVQYGVLGADEYVTKVVDSISKLGEDINGFNGYITDAGQLQGDIAEFWHGDTFNIRAAVLDSDYSAHVDRSHGLASPDIRTNFGENYGLKYYKYANASVNAQSMSYFQRFCEYKYQSGRTDLSFEDFLIEKGISEDVLMHDPIYSGQMRLIPADQYEEAIAYLKFKIAKETITRPEQVARYQDTLDRLTNCIKSPDGKVYSDELNRNGAGSSEEIAGLAKEGKFNPADYGFTTEQLISFRHALQQGVKAGTTAAVISLVLKTAPEIYHCLELLIKEGYIDEEQFKILGFSAVNGAADGFLKGFVAGTLTTSCESGLLGPSLKGISPGMVGALTVVLMQTMKDSFAVVKGEMTENALIANLSKNVFVTSCGLGLGLALQLTGLPFAYLLGNFVGSMVGSFAYVAIDNAVMALAVNNGWTFFGIVKQDYKLPEEIAQEIGLDICDYIHIEPIKVYPKIATPVLSKPIQATPITVRYIRRGVIGVHQVGYINT